MIIHSPIISGSLTFAEGATVTYPDGGEYSGSFSGSIQISEVQSHLIPDSSASYDLGSESFPFRDLYVSSNTIKIGGIGIGAGIGGINFKNTSDDSPAEVAVKSITIGGLLGGVGGGKKFKLNSNNKVTLEDDNGDVDTLEVNEIILKDTSGAGKNTKLTNDGGKFTTQETADDGTVSALDSEGSLSGSFTGSIQDADFNGDATFNDNATFSGTTTVSGLSSLDGGIDVDGAFTVADSTGNVSTTGTLNADGNGTIGGTLGVTGNTTLSGTLSAGNTTVGTLDSTGLASLDGGIDVDGAFTVADSTGNVSTTGTLSAGNTDVATLDASGLASLDGGIDVDGVFTVSDSTGNVSTSGTLNADGNGTIGGTLGVTGNTTLSGTLSAGNTTVGTLGSSGLASLDGGIDVDGAFTVADSTGNVSTSGTLSVTGLTTVGTISGSAGDFTGDLSVGGDLTVAGAMTNDGHIIPALHNTYDLGSTTKFWRDLYLSSGSLYINGIQVLSTDGTDLTFQTDEGESTKILETGNDTITLESVNGDITLTASGTGNIELDAPVQIGAGKNVLSSDGNAISFASDVDLGSNDITVGSLTIGSTAVSSTAEELNILDGATLTTTELNYVDGVTSAIQTQLDSKVGDISHLNTFTSSFNDAITLSSDDVTILGDLTVQGDTTTLNTATLNVTDLNITVANGAATAAAANGAGLTVDGASATLTYASTGDKWVFNKVVDVPTSGILINGTAVTSTATELNLLDGVSGLVKADFTKLAAVTSTAAELNILDGVTSTAAELNLLDGVSGLVKADFTKLAAVDASAAELNKLDGVTATTTELNYVDGVTSNIQTQLNGKQATITGAATTIDSEDLTASRALIANGDGKVAVSAVTSTELGYLDGVSSAIQTQLNGKQTTITGAATTIDSEDLTVSRALVSNSSGKVAVSAVTSTEIGYLDGVSSNIQTQLNAKAGGDDFDADGTFASLRAQGTTAGDVGLGAGDDVTFGSVRVDDATASTSKTTGALIVDGGVGIEGALNVGGDVVAYASSDERLKDNVELIENPIEKVQQLKGVTWDWNDNADELQKSLPNVGVIAQDVEKVLPQLVKDRDNGFKGVDYAKLTGLLIEAIKDQQAQIDELKSKLS